MKIVHFKYSALTLALISNFAVANLAQTTQVADAPTATIDQQHVPAFELRNQNITEDESPKSVFLHLNNVAKSVIENVSITNAKNPVGIIHIANTNLTVNSLNVTSTNKESRFGIFLAESNASINNMTVDVTIANSPHGALYFDSQPEQSSTVTNSSIANHGDNSTVVGFENHNATFRHVALNTTGKGSTLFSIRDNSQLIADNITANNAGDNGFVIQVEKSTVIGEHGNSFSFENSHITSKQGINWIENGDDTDLAGNIQTVKIHLDNTTLEAKDQLVHATRNDYDIFTTVFELQNNSTLIGGFKEPNSTIDITLHPTSTWKMTSDSHIQLLSSSGEQSLIDFAYDDSDKTKTLSVDWRYSGNHSFNLNSKLVDNQSDKIVINNRILENSRAILNITDRSGNDEFENPNHSATVLEATPDYANNITVILNGTNYVNAGGYRYHLANETTTNGQAIWKLTSLLKDGEPVKDPDFNKPKVEDPKAEDPKMKDPKDDELVPYSDDEKISPHEDLNLPPKDDNKPETNPEAKPEAKPEIKPEIKPVNKNMKKTRNITLN